jgi:hypothetical protein
VPHNIISSVKHLNISASHAYEALLVLAIFRCFVLPSLSQLTLDLDLEEMHFPISHEDDWEKEGIPLMQRFSSLTRDVPLMLFRYY